MLFKFFRSRADSGLSGAGVDGNKYSLQHYNHLFSEYVPDFLITDPGAFGYLRFSNQ